MDRALQLFSILDYFLNTRWSSCASPGPTPALAAALRSPPGLLLPTAAPTQSARTTSPSAPACGLNPPDIFGAILLLCCYFARDPRVIPAREGGEHCRADGRAHLAAPRPPEERHKAQARAPPHRGAADREGRRGRACAWAGRGRGAGRGGGGAREGALRPQLHLPHLPGDPRAPPPPPGPGSPRLPRTRRALPRGPAVVQSSHHLTSAAPRPRRPASRPRPSRQPLGGAAGAGRKTLAKPWPRLIGPGRLRSFAWPMRGGRVEVTRLGLAGAGRAAEGGTCLGAGLASRSFSLSLAAPGLAVLF